MNQFFFRWRSLWPKQVFLIGRFGQSLFWRMVTLLFTAGYSSFFVYAVFFARRRRGLSERFLNPVPVIGTVDNFIALTYKSPKELYEFGTNLFGNIALFIPLSFILIYYLPIRTLSNLLLASFILSLSVEATQFVLKRGVADVDDILLNTLGAWVGYRLYQMLFGDPFSAEA